MRHPMSVAPVSAALAALFIAPALAQDTVGDTASAPEVNRVAEIYDGLAPGLDENNSQRVHILYDGFFLGIRVMKADLTAEIGDGAYEAGGVFRTAGLAGWFDDTDIEVNTFGALNGQGVEPRLYRHMNHASSKNRTVAIDFEGGVAEPVVTPDFGSHGDPAPSLEDLTGALDPIGAFVAITLDGGVEPCNRTLPVFDGKQRYDIRFESVGMEEVDLKGYEGPALHCHFYYTPVSGFDPEDLASPEDYARPKDIWLADLGEGRWAPVRIRTRVSGVNVAIEAKRVEVDAAALPRHVEAAPSSATSG